MEGGKNYDGRSAATIYSRKSDPPRNESLKVSWAGYVGADFVGSIIVFGDGEIFPGDAIHVLAVMLGHGLDDAVAGTDIVEEKIAVGVKLLFTECRGDSVSAAVDICSHGSGGERLDVADIATNFVEQFSAMARMGGLCQLCIARGRFSG